MLFDEAVGAPEVDGGRHGRLYAAGAAAVGGCMRVLAAGATTWRAERAPWGSWTTGRRVLRQSWSVADSVSQPEPGSCQRSLAKSPALGVCHRVELDHDDVLQDAHTRAYIHPRRHVRPPRTCLTLTNPAMNSYPPELLVQLAPVMFVAGLGPQPAAAAAAPQSPAPRTQDPFVLLATRLKDALLAQRKPAVWAPDKSKTFQVVLVEPVSARSASSAVSARANTLCSYLSHKSD